MQPLILMEAYMGIPSDKSWPYEQRCYVANRLANWPFCKTRSKSIAEMFGALRAIELVTLESSEFCEANRGRFEEMVNEVESRGGKSATPQNEVNHHG